MSNHYVKDSKIIYISVLPVGSLGGVAALVAGQGCRVRGSMHLLHVLSLYMNDSVMVDI